MGYEPYMLNVYGVATARELADAVTAVGGVPSRARRINNTTKGEGRALVALLPLGYDPRSLPCHSWEHLHTNERGNGTRLAPVLARR